MSGISLHFDAMSDIKSKIEALSLVGSPTVEIEEVSGYQDGKKTLPYISISPFSREKFVEDTPVPYNGWDYPILVVIYAGVAQVSLEQRLSWRQNMFNKIANSSIPSLGANWNLVIEPGPIVEMEAYLSRKGAISSFIVYARMQSLRIP